MCRLLQIISASLVALLSLNTTSALAEDLKSALARADHLENQGRYTQQLDLLLQIDQGNPNNAEVLPRLSSAYSNVVNQLADDRRKREYAELALSTAKRAVAKAPNSSKAHSALSVAYGNITDFVDNKTKMRYSKVIKSEAEKAIQLDADNSVPYFILARWNYEMATLNPIMKGFAELLYGQLPPASKEKAMDLFRKAIALSPNEIGYHAEYARALENSGQPQLARVEWKKVLQLPAVDAQDKKYQAEAQKHQG